MGLIPTGKREHLDNRRLGQARYCWKCPSGQPECLETESSCCLYVGVLKWCLSDLQSQQICCHCCDAGDNSVGQAAEWGWVSSTGCVMSTWSIGAGTKKESSHFRKSKEISPSPCSLHLVLYTPACHSAPLCAVIWKVQPSRASWLHPPCFFFFFFPACLSISPEEIEGYSKSFV